MRIILLRFFYLPETLNFHRLQSIKLMDKCHPCVKCLSSKYCFSESDVSTILTSPVHLFYKHKQPLLWKIWNYLALVNLSLVCIAYPNFIALFYPKHVFYTQLRDGVRMFGLQNRRRELVFLQQKWHVTVGQLQHHCGGNQRAGEEHFRARRGGRGLYW